ncbi:phage tail protein [Loigolactobacillus backii]|uniref:phage tail protein n=1 Tax=Loigolactobacillus backii TaxID=375175 RepID=UPI0007F0A08D|nr:phage tail protein [Loigolactobacillus backii]ANK60027.1 phage tail protein [Loigolactobacillus backii]
MANGVGNEKSFDMVLDNLARGIGVAEKLAANNAGAEVFIQTMKPKIPESSHLRKGEKRHLRDSLVKDEKPNGAVVVGFTADENKGYIGRFQNDGWTPKDKTGKTYAPVAGSHFWEATQREAKGKVQVAVAEVVKREMDRKVRGG